MRKTWLTGGLKVANVGQAYDLTYPVQQLGASASLLSAIADGSHDFAKVLKDAKRPMVIVGPGAFVRIRQDARWSVPEPELALVVSPAGLGSSAELISPASLISLRPSRPS